jgi:type IV pilus assembly protein PilM
LISLGSLFSRQPAPLLGLDISSSSVKLVELGRDKAGNLVLERCAIEPLERGWITDGNVEKFDEVADAVRRLVKKSGTKTKNVAMALPPSAVITKRIVLPGGLTDQELEVQVEAEANQYIPFPLDEVSLDFCVVGPSSSSVGDLDVLIAASRREKVQDIQGLAEAAGLKPVVVDVESYASRLATSRLIESLPNKGVGTIVALFEVGALTTSMQVIRDDEVLYDRDQAFGGAQLTQLIVRQYGFSLGRGGKQEAQRRTARRLRIQRAAALCREHGAGNRTCLAVLLHQHAAQQGRPHHAGRRLGGIAGSHGRGDQAYVVQLQPGQSVRRHGDRQTVSASRK